MKSLIVNSNKQFTLKQNLTCPVAEQGEVLVKVKSASLNFFDAQSAEGRFDS